MIKRRTRNLSVTTALAIFAGAAQADLPAREPGEPTVTVTYQNGQITMRDILDQTPLVMPRPNMPMYAPVPNGLMPTISFVEQPTGYDMVFDFRNNFTDPRPLGVISINTVTLGPVVNAPDFRFSGQDREITLDNPPAWTHNYPGLLYSPAFVMHNDRHAIGVSLHYPILEYKHDISIALRARTSGPPSQGEGGPGFQVRFNLSSATDGGAGLLYPALLQPGESRRYIVSVRMTRTTHEWIRTLVPYRTYFQNLYGRVQYPRQRDAVRVHVVAATHNISSENPFGFDFRRPDRNGFSRMVTDLLNLQNFGRFMIWSPTGVYNNEHNYPFQFTSRWTEDPNLMTIFDTRNGLPRLSSEGRNVGLWWGNAGKFAATWNPTHLEGFNPRNSLHVERAFHEVDLAVGSGARVIGLDTFGHRSIPTWDAYPWLQRMRARYPDVKFVMEPKAIDIMHTIAAGYFRGYELPASGVATSRSDVHALDSPHYLADFLVPGHETWANMRWEMYTSLFGSPATVEEMQRDVYEAAELGYIPLISNIFEFDPNRTIAAESWLFTVPEDLRQEAANSGFVGNVPRLGRDRASQPQRPRIQDVIRSSGGSSPPAAQAPTAPKVVVGPGPGGRIVGTPTTSGQTVGGTTIDR
ncbi:MAG: hypothetical protein KF866_09915 [Phycisphaeraceae bacterium]|nr:hypothetical protein [Phycisphaeraceae bacterium]MCW5754815.1 hypothetical protein [Phycisphaeraceae bacterium]